MPIKDKLKSLKEELGTFSFWKSVRCEFLITMLYVFMGCGALTHIREPSDDMYIKVALTFGLAEATLVQCVGHISGAHLNPAVTVAMLVTGKLGMARALCYMIAQCVGGIAGAGILYGATPSIYHGSLGVTFIKDSVKPAQAFAVEFMITFVLVFTYFANLEPKRVDMGSRSLSIGLSVCLGHLFAVSIKRKTKLYEMVFVVFSLFSFNFDLFVTFVSFFFFFFFFFFLLFL